MLTALIAIAGSLLGVVLGFFAQHLQADLAHRRHLDDLKREAYAGLLRADSASYAQASSGGGTSEDAALLKARAVIELLAGSEIGSAARNLEHLVSKAHERLREAGYEAARADIDAADQARLELIRLFKATSRSGSGQRSPRPRTAAPSQPLQPFPLLTWPGPSPTTAALTRIEPPFWVLRAESGGRPKAAHNWMTGCSGLPDLHHQRAATPGQPHRILLARAGRPVLMKPHQRHGAILPA